jgi:hypothetical protein
MVDKTDVRLVVMMAEMLVGKMVDLMDVMTAD